MLGLDEEFGQRLGIGRVPGLRALRLRHVKLIEEHGLQLLRRTQVDLVADCVVRLLRARFGLLRELLDEVGQSGLVDGDSGRLHPSQHGHERQFDVAIHLSHVRFVDGGGEDLVDFEQGCGALTVSGHRRIRVEVESELSGVSFGFAEVDAGTFGGDLSEFVGSGIGDEEVGGQRRVSADVGDVESDRREGFDLELRRVEDERSGSQSRAEPGRSRLSRLGEVDDPGLPGFGGDGEDAGVSVTEFEARIGIEREDIVVGDMTEQRIDVDGLDGGLPCRCGVGLSAGGLGEDRCEALAEGLEFELIEQARQFARVPLLPRRGRRSADRDRRRRGSKTNRT